MPAGSGPCSGEGDPATSASIAPGTGRVGAGRAFSIPRGWRLDCVSALGRAEWGFSCGFSLLFFFPRRFIFRSGNAAWLGFSGRGWEAAAVCLSVRLLSILRGRGGRDTGGPGRRDISGALGAPAGQIWDGFAFPILRGRCDPGSFHGAGLWCPSRNSWRMHSAFHGAQPSPELCSAAPGSCGTRWGG